MGYKTATYGLTTLGKIGAVLFVAPTPIAGFYLQPPKLSAGEIAFNERMQSMGGQVDMFTPSPTILILLATATLIGAVMLLVGRELVTYEA